MSPGMEEVLRTIGRITGPTMMTPSQALDFLEELTDELKAQMEALRDEDSNGHGD